MISLSKSELEAYTYLVRNYTERLTVRKLAEKIQVSAPGLHAGLTKLESEKLLTKNKFGSGLFYDINYDNHAARHLASYCLLVTSKQEVAIEHSPHDILIVRGKNILLVSDTHAHVATPAGYTLSIQTLNEFREKLRKRDADISTYLREGSIISGAQHVVHLLMEEKPRW